jgi:hypothetical protein
MISRSAAGDEVERAVMLVIEMAGPVRVYP